MSRMRLVSVSRNAKMLVKSRELELQAVKQRLCHACPSIERILQISGTPGLSIGVVHHGCTILVDHFGFRDVEALIAADEHTRYGINSMSKAIVAMLVGMLVDEGKLTWDTPVRKKLSDFHSTDKVVEEQGTLVDLLSHRTGITALDAIWLQAQNTILLGKDQALKNFGHLKSRLPFRSSFLYNNSAYDVVTAMIEQVTGESLSDLLEGRIFGPLGMTRSSTSWESADDNVAKSYQTLEDRSPCEVPPPQLGKGTLMEAAGGVKSTISDLLILYSKFLDAANSQFESESDATSDSIFKQCRMLLNTHAILPGVSLREQGYAAGWAKAQLPGQLGRVAWNPLLGSEPVVGRESESRICVYHHGCMPGSTSAVHLFPETTTAIVVLQNSLSATDSADLVGQLLAEAIFDFKVKVDYLELASQFAQVNLNHQATMKSELERKRKRGTFHKPLDAYVGRYQNFVHNFQIEVYETGKDGLNIRFQGRKDEEYALWHYQDDIFSWLMPHNDAVRRGRVISDFTSQHYLMHFKGSEDNAIDTLEWAWDPEFEECEKFTKKATNVGHK